MESFVEKVDPEEIIERLKRLIELIKKENATHNVEKLTHTPSS